MTSDQAKNRHAELAAEIRRHDRAYDEGRPLISDYDYDLLERELLDIETEHPDLATADSPSSSLRSEPLSRFERREHLLPMLSLEKIQAASHPTREEEPNEEIRKRLQDQNTLKELSRFDETLRKQLGRSSIDYVIEPKVDGVSISVHYRHGKLALAMTRGDGKAGDDITANVRKIRSIPLELKLKSPPALIEVRGEACISHKDFEAVNASLSASGENPFPNARNATAGTLKQLNPRLVARRPISAVFYAVGACDGIRFDTHTGALEALKRFGLPTQSWWRRCSGMDEVLACYADEVVAHYDEARDLRGRLPYDIDGIVIKVNTLADWARIPAKAKAPGYAIVHKPIPWITPAETVLNDITVQVGRTGVLTPVAELEPVFVQGSTVARATLHNEDEIRRKDIRIGDTVIVRKAGMVIPEIVEVVKSKRPAGAREFDLFKHVHGKCPACNGPIAKETAGAGDKEEVAWRCQNIAGCPAQLTRRVEYFAQRKALDIESLGGIVAEKLVERGLVKDPLDLFELKLEPLAKLNLGTDDEPRVLGAKNATKIVEALERARALPLHRWILALAIPDVGESIAYDLARLHRDLDDLAGSNLLKLIAGEGKSTAALREEIDPRLAQNASLSAEAEARRQGISKEIAAYQNELKEATAHLSRVDLPAEEAKRWKKVRDGAKNKLKTRENKLMTVGLSEEIGPVVAASLVRFFSERQGRNLLDRLRKMGIRPTETPSAPSDAAALPLAGRTFVLTGTLPTLSRDEASRLIREAGGTVTGSVSKNTDFLLAGEEAGSKLDKAKELGTRVLTESEFLEMLDSSPKKERTPAKRQSELF